MFGFVVVCYDMSGFFVFFILFIIYKCLLNINVLGKEVCDCKGLF